MKSQIREYTAADREGCLMAFKSNVPLYFTEDEINDFALFLDRLSSQPVSLQDRTTHFFVVLSDDQVIGCGGFGDKDGKNIISLAWGLIHSDFHKKGLGAKLLAYRLNEIRQLYPGLPVVIDTTQHSYPFFEKYGFSTEKITNDFYTTGMHRYDMVLKPSAL